MAKVKELEDKKRERAARFGTSSAGSAAPELSAEEEEKYVIHIPSVFFSFPIY
jgi:hypothetical protein